MRITADLHTHTTFSHGRNTIEEMVDRARDLGLAAIAISDHGRSHPLYGVKPRHFRKMRAIIDDLNAKYDDIQIYLSVEANIIGADGTIDISEEERRYCDFIYAGYHWVYVPKGFRDFFTLKLRNYLTWICPWMTKRTRAANTRCYLAMLNHYDLKMITHPGDKCPIDVVAVAKKAAEKHVILEINPRHHHLNAEELRQVMGFSGRFAINSDAHSVDRVADVAPAIDAAMAAGVPVTQIVNAEASGRAAEKSERKPK